MTRLQKSLVFSLAGVLCLLVTILVLEVVQPGGYQGLRGLFDTAEVAVPIETPEITAPPQATPTPTPPPSLPDEEYMPREDIDGLPPYLPPFVGVTQAESAAQIFANTGDVIRFGNFDWRVLERQGTIALVISENIVFRCSAIRITE